jgi:hypothetical protein
VGFLRRLIGGSSGSARDAEAAGETEAADDPSRSSAADIETEEGARELELLRAEQERLGDLVLRQQRYADRSWVPPAQGGSRRADDGESNDAAGG